MIDAAAEARQQGLVRGIGVTGHGLQIAVMHRRSLDRFDFDSVLLPKVLDAASRWEQVASNLLPTNPSEYLSKLNFAPLFV